MQQSAGHRGDSFIGCPMPDTCLLASRVGPVLVSVAESLQHFKCCSRLYHSFFLCLVFLCLVFDFGGVLLQLPHVARAKWPVSTRTRTSAARSMNVVRVPPWALSRAQPPAPGEWCRCCFGYTALGTGYMKRGG